MSKSQKSSEKSSKYSDLSEKAIIFAFEKDKSDLKIGKLRKVLQSIKFHPRFEKQSNGFKFQCKTPMINPVVKALNANSISFVLRSSLTSTVFVETADRNKLFDSKLFVYIGNHSEFFGYQCFFRTINDFIDFNQKYLNGELKSIGVTAIFPYRIMSEKTNNPKPQDWPQEILKKSDIQRCNEQLKEVQQKPSEKPKRSKKDSFRNRLEEALNQHHICGDLREYFIEAANNIEDKNNPDLNIIKAICDSLNEDSYEVLVEMFSEDQDYEKVCNEFLDEYFNEAQSLLSNVTTKSIQNPSVFWNNKTNVQRQPLVKLFTTVQVELYQQTYTMYVTHIKDKSLSTSLDWLVQDNTDKTLFVTSFYRYLIIFKEGKIVVITIPPRQEIPSLLFEFLQKPEFKYIEYRLQPLSKIILLEKKSNYYEYQTLFFNQYKIDWNNDNISLYSPQQYNSVPRGKFGKPNNASYFYIANECIFTCLSYKFALEKHPLAFEIYQQFTKYNDLLIQEREILSAHHEEVDEDIDEDDDEVDDDDDPDDE